MLPHILLLFLKIFIFSKMIKSNRTRNRKIKEERDLVNNLFTLDHGTKSDTFIDSCNIRLQDNSNIPILTLDNLTPRLDPNLASSVHQPHSNSILSNISTVDNWSEKQSTDNNSSLVLDTTTLPNFDDGLAHWVVNHNVPMITVNSLLSLLRTHKCFSSLPKDSRTLLHTSSKFDYTPRVVELGLYYHFGIAKGIFQNYVTNENYFSLKIAVGVDGRTPSFKIKWKTILAYFSVNYN